MSNNITVRAASRDDAGDIARLLSQRGDSANATTLIGRLSRLETTGLDQVLLAEANDVVAGLLVVHLIPALLHDDRPLAYITALMYETQPEAGAALLEAAEDLARQAGCSRIETSNGVSQANTHVDALYTSRGYVVAHALLYKSLR